MGPREREAAQRRGQRKLEAMKRRTGQLRRRAIATAIVGFVVLWTAVFVQMATGNDPVLGTNGAVRPAAKKKRASELEPRSLQPTAPPQSAVERVETEQREAEARELEALEAVTTGQS
jgi:hypothetical protein